MTYILSIQIKVSLIRNLSMFNYKMMNPANPEDFDHSISSEKLNKNTPGTDWRFY